MVIVIEWKHISFIFWFGLKIRKFFYADGSVELLSFCGQSKFDLFFSFQLWTVWCHLSAFILVGFHAGLQHNDFFFKAVSLLRVNWQKKADTTVLYSRVYFRNTKTFLWLIRNIFLFMSRTDGNWKATIYIFTANTTFIPEILWKRNSDIQNDSTTQDCFFFLAIRDIFSHLYRIR